VFSLATSIKYISLDPYERENKEIGPASKHSTTCQLISFFYLVWPCSHLSFRSFYRVPHGDYQTRDVKGGEQQATTTILFMGMGLTRASPASYRVMSNLRPAKLPIENSRSSSLLFFANTSMHLLYNNGAVKWSTARQARSYLFVVDIPSKRRCWFRRSWGAVDPDPVARPIMASSTKYFRLVLRDDWNQTTALNHHHSHSINNSIHNQEWSNGDCNWRYESIARTQP
jgi:hypothetical protein